MKTTLNKIRSHSPCEQGWVKLLKHLNKTTGDDESLPFIEILKSNGLNDAIWCMRTAPEYDKEWRLFAVWCARQVPQSPTGLATLAVAERYANGLASEEELMSARAARAARAEAAAAAAWSAAAWAAEVAAEAAAEAAAAWAAEAAARAAAWAAAWSAAAAAEAAEAAWATQTQYLEALF